MDFEGVETDIERWSAGMEILKLTDGLGFNAQAAGWVYAPEHDQWRYYLITSMVDEQGPRWIYERLLKVFAKVELPAGITPLDVYIASPKDALYRALKKQKMPERFASERAAFPKNALVQFDVERITVAPGVVVEKAFFYRLEHVHAKPSPRLFDKRVQQLLAA